MFRRSDLGLSRRSGFIALQKADDIACDSRMNQDAERVLLSIIEIWATKKGRCVAHSFLRSILFSCGHKQMGRTCVSLYQDLRRRTGTSILVIGL
jgi:hypothetical protein